MSNKAYIAVAGQPLFDDCLVINFLQGLALENRYWWFKHHVVVVLITPSPLPALFVGGPARKKGLRVGMQSNILIMNKQSDYVGAQATK